MKVTKFFRIDYYQKSSAYLLPFCGLSKSDIYTPVNTYLYCSAIDESIVDYKLLALYKYHEKIRFSEFEKKHILTNPQLETCYLTEDGVLYVFDISKYKSTVDQFLEGKYSIFSKDSKEIILKYHKFYRESLGRAITPDDVKNDEVTLKEGNSYYILTSLYPSEFKDQFAEELVSKFDVYKNVYEAKEVIRDLDNIAPIFDLDKETLNTKIIES